ncbi:MAG: flagellar biosynthesis protein FliQ [Myxococcales bacterium]|nr:flagellar biosynthesis protein FliQ [Myxococcota bacterium]MDW8283358.1 flagellar biosynthesis protein FliQ [Myxococcales bacterium]
MDADLVLDVCRRSLETSLLVMAPLVLSALVAGVLAGLFQAATQIQEPTLAFVPKIVALGIALMLFGPWMLDRMRTFTVDTIDLVGRLQR